MKEFRLPANFEELRILNNSPNVGLAIINANEEHEPRRCCYERVVVQIEAESDTNREGASVPPFFNLSTRNKTMK